jgi:phospholipid/cholesterol/gamma-HCH transport system substrate-binding protein
VDVLRQAAGTIERVDKIIRRIDESVLSSQSLSHVSSVFANFDATTSNTTALTQSLRDIVEENRQNVSNAVAKVSSAAGTLQNASRRVDDLVVTNQDDIRIAIQNLTESSERLNTMMTRLEQGEGTLGKLIVDPSLHDEVLRLVRNLRRYGLLYKEGAAAKAVDQQRGKTPAAGRPAQKGTGTLNFGTDSTTPTDGK